MKSTFFLAIIVIVEIFTIAFLGLHIFQRQTDSFVASLHLLPKDSLVFTKSGELNYFYEPKSNSTRSYKIEGVPYESIHTINADTLHERFDYSVEKPTDTFRIVTLGDSFTFGVYVNTAENYTEKLEEWLNDDHLCESSKKFEVINLGVPAYDIRYAVERFKKRGEKYDPDLVLWLVGYNDFVQIAELIHEKMSPLTEKLHKGTVSPSYWLSAFYETAKEIEKDVTKEERYRYQRAALYTLTENYHNNLIMFTSPRYINKEEGTILLDFANSSERIHFSEIVSEDIIDEEYIIKPGDFHPNQKGHLIITQNLFSYLKTNNFIPCKK